VSAGLAGKRCTAADAAARVRSGDELAIPLAPAQPSAFLHALGERDDLGALTLISSLTSEHFPLLDRPGVRLLSGFWGHVERHLAAEGRDVEFVPSDFRRYSRLLRRRSPRIVATLAAPPDAEGGMSLSLHAGGTVEEIRRCARDPERLLVVEVNPRLPRTHGLPPGHPHCIHLDEADVILESERPLWQIPEVEATAVEHAIAEHVRRYVPDGATLQTGIGAMPNEVAKLLAAGPGGDYGIHSEMFTTGLMRLCQAGKVTNRKGQHEGYAVCTFAGGTPELYAWLHENTSVRFLPVDLVNEPGVISRNRRMVSINAAISVDLAGQVTADTVRGRQHSGTGGHEDFVSGASLSEGGHSLVCLPATARHGGRTVSRIVARLAAGAVVTTPRHQVDVVVTEFGAAELAGRTVSERAASLAEIAHPEFRDALRDEAKRIATRP
jgi:acyl-CoA hydrolase